ncbi:response regulator [Cellulomonas endophytica]|uniref:response regulator n=1 Tax=Cellulomonas endophytica TaxID=2494735 RepID=UPI001013B8AB|nr:response regulator transcription factor [Cellulomonas endophytica]
MSAPTADGRAAAGDAPVRVVLVDDQALLRAGIAIILGAEPGIEVVGEAASGAEAIDLVRRLRPDVVCMDVQMPGMDGLEATRRLVADPDVHAGVLVLTTFQREDYLVAALAAGASGFLLKNARPEGLVAAVRAVAAGDALLSPEVTRAVIERAVAGGLLGTAAAGTATGVPAGTPAAAPPAPPAAPAPSAPPGAAAHRTGSAGANGATGALAALTERELEVLGLVARGMSNDEVAAALVLGRATVKTHVSNVLMKLGLRDRVQAVVFAHEHGLVGR